MTRTTATVLPTPAAEAAGVRVWDLPLRLFHWLLVAAVAVAFVSAEEDSILRGWHVTAGWIAALLIGFRLVWGFIGGEHARFASFVRPSRLRAHLATLVAGRPEASLGHNPLGAIATLVLLITVAAVVATGTMLIGGGGGGEDLHEGLANALLALIGLHVAAVLMMSVLSRENLVRAMVTGRKPRARHPGAVDGRPAPGLALPVAALAIAGGGYGILQFDPLAMTPGAHSEAGEGGGEDAD